MTALNAHSRQPQDGWCRTPGNEMREFPQVREIGMWAEAVKNSALSSSQAREIRADHVWSILCCMPRNRSGKGRPVHILQGNKWVYWFVCYPCSSEQAWADYDAQLVAFGSQVRCPNRWTWIILTKSLWIEQDKGWCTLWHHPAHIIWQCQLNFRIFIRNSIL